jgi:hypothetical protein
MSLDSAQDDTSFDKLRMTQRLRMTSGGESCNPERRLLV